MRAEAVCVTAALHPLSNNYGLYDGLFKAFLEGEDLTQGFKAVLPHKQRWPKQRWPKWRAPK